MHSIKSCHVDVCGDVYFKNYLKKIVLQCNLIEYMYEKVLHCIQTNLILQHMN